MKIASIIRDNIGINKKRGLGRSSSYAARHVIDSLAGSTEVRKQRRIDKRCGI